MRTFHTGGVAGDDITQGLPRIQEILKHVIRKDKRVITEVTGEVIDISEDPAHVKRSNHQRKNRYTYLSVPYCRMKVAEGDIIHRCTVDRRFN